MLKSVFDSQFGVCRILGFSTVIMLMISWKLWINHSEIPPVPWIAGWEISPIWSAIWFGTLLFACIGLILSQSWKITRVIASLAIVAGLMLILGDQHRMQPWMQQFLFISLAISCCNHSRWALGYTRVYAIALYFHSGLSKLDWSFAHDIGPALLQGLGLAHSSSLLALAMPLAELLMATGLCFAVTRVWAMSAVIAMHGLLVIILGPWCWDQSANVLIWNIAMALEAWILFRPSIIDQDLREREPGRWDFWPRLAALIIVVGPFFERSGCWDSWPAFALYASHCERIDVDLAVDDLDRFPQSVQNASRPVEESWRRLNLTAWSRSVRGTPVYPQNRACLAIALTLARQGTVRVIINERADRWTGNRPQTELMSIEAIQRFSSRYWINSRTMR